MMLKYYAIINKNIIERWKRMKLENLTFKGGVHVPHSKELTEKKSLEYAKEPSIVYIPLHQHVGAPCEPIS